jgi:hypothetical protein
VDIVGSQSGRDARQGWLRVEAPPFRLAAR